MSAGALIVLALQASIVLTVFTLGLDASPHDTLYLFRRPAWLGRALIAMNVVMPVVAAVGVAAFDFHPAVKLALIALAVSPVPPLLPKKGLRSGADTSYTFGLLVAAAMLAVAFVPLAIEVLGKAFGTSAYISPLAIGRLVSITVLLPLAAGVAVRHWAPALAARIARPMARAATVLLAASALPIVVAAWPAIVGLIGNGTVLAFVVFVVIGLATGQMLGGPGSEERTVLALCTACRHPGVALAIAGANYPEQKSATAAVLLYLVVAGIISSLYLARRRRRSRGAQAVSV